MNGLRNAPGFTGPMPAERVTAILKARAAALAKPVETGEAAENLIEVVEFRLATERYALEQQYVREVHILRNLTYLPGTPRFMRGIINVRGQIMPVLDIKKFFDLPDGGITDLHVVLIVRAAHMDVGILADTVTGVASIRAEDVQSSLPTLTQIRSQYLKGITRNHTVILDAWKMLSDPKMIVNEEAGIAFE